MTLKTRIAALALASVALTGLGPVAAHAAPIASTEASPQPTDGSSPLEAPALTPEEEQFLAEQGVEGEMTAQEDANGATMYLDDEGDWVITPPADPGTGVSPMFTAGACTGTFYDPAKINDTLEWGAQSSCGSSPPNAIFPHYIEVTLRDTCSGFPCGVYETLWTETSNNSRYATVATVATADACEASDDRNYDLLVVVYVAGTQFGPFNSPPTDVAGCHVHPAPGGVG